MDPFRSRALSQSAVTKVLGETIAQRTSSVNCGCQLDGSGGQTGIYISYEYNRSLGLCCVSIETLAKREQYCPYRCCQSTLTGNHGTRGLGLQIRYPTYTWRVSSGLNKNKQSPAPSDTFRIIAVHVLISCVPFGNICDADSNRHSGILISDLVMGKYLYRVNNFAECWANSRILNVIEY